MIPVLIGVIIIIIVITAITPGDPIDHIVGINASENIRQDIREELGLEAPVVVQWANYLTNIITKF